MTHTESQFLRAWARTVIRYRWLFLALTVIATGTMANEARTKLRIDNSVEAFLARQSAAAVSLEDSRDAFGRDDLFLIMIEGDVFSVPYLEKLQKLHAELESLDIPLQTLGERRADRQRERMELRQDFGFEKKNEFTQNAEKDTTIPDSEEDEFADFGDDEGWGDEVGGGVMDEVISLINVRQTRGTEDGGIVVGDLMDPFPLAKDLPKIKAKVLADPTLVGQVVNHAGDHSIIALRTQFMGEEDSNKLYLEVRKIAETYDGEGFKVLVAGLPALAAELNTLLLGDMGRLAIFAFLMMVVILTFIFRHPFGLFGPVLVVVMSVIMSMGIMAMLGMPMTMLTTILPAFVLCVGLGDAIHLLSIYRDQRREGIENNEAICKALAITGKPIFFTTITTMFGLLSFRLAAVQAIQDLGTAGAFGVVLALIHTFVFLVALMSFNTKSMLGVRSAAASDLLDRFLDRCLRFSGQGLAGAIPSQNYGRKRRITLATGLVLALTAGYGASQLKVWHNPLSWVPEDKYLRYAFDQIDAKVGGAATVQILVEGTSERGVKDLKILQGMDKLVEHIKEYRDPKSGMVVVSNAISILDPIRETHRALLAGKDSEYRIPDTQETLTDCFTLFENAAPDKLGRIITLNGTMTLITLRTRWLEATSYGPLTEHIDVGVQKYLPPEIAVVKPTGSVYNVFTTVSLLLRDLLRSFGAAFAIITVLMMFMLRSLKLGLIAMIPNLLPIAFIMGLMGFAGVPIDMANLLIGSIALGVAVDDTIHFLHHFRVRYADGGNLEAAIKKAITESGRAMTATSIVLCAGFYVYIAATMFSIQRFGFLIGTTVIFALLIDLIGCPALLRTLFKSKPAATPTAD